MIGDKIKTPNHFSHLILCYDYDCNRDDSRGIVHTAYDIR
jgi:hypothetical protein